MKIFNKVKYLSVLVFLAVMSFSFALDKGDIVNVDDAYKKVNLDSYIKNQRPDKKNGKSILPIKRITFGATLMSKPEAGEFKYIYMALELMGMKPLPVIKHQVFVQSEDGTVISVYMEEYFANTLDKHIRLGNIKIGQHLLFKGYHSYNYKRGPAMVMEGLFDAEKDKLIKEPSKSNKEQEALAKVATKDKDDREVITDAK